MASRLMPRSYLTDLICTACGAAWTADEPHGVCPACGKVLFAQYDLAALRAAMPVPDLGGRDWGELLVKDEGANPTGSFKARGLSMAVARAVELGVVEVALPSAGNAGAAAAAYAAAHGIACHVAMPRDAP